MIPVASRRPSGSRPLARPVRSASPVSCAERSSSCRLRRRGDGQGPMRKITPVSKTSIRVETRHIGPAARLTPVPTHAVERRALAKTAAPRSALAGWSCGKAGEGNGRQTASKVASTSRRSAGGEAASREATARIASGSTRPVPIDADFVEDCLLLRPTPEGVRLARNFCKIRFRFVRFGGKSNFAKFSAELTAAGQPSPLPPSGTVPMEPKENYHGIHDRKPHHQDRRLDGRRLRHAPRQCPDRRPAQHRTTASSTSAPGSRSARAGTGSRRAAGQNTSQSGWRPPRSASSSGTWPLHPAAKKARRCSSGTTRSKPSRTGPARGRLPRVLPATIARTGAHVRVPHERKVCLLRKPSLP